MRHAPNAALATATRGGTGRDGRGDTRPVRLPSELFPRARQVAVVSSFNSWDAKAHPLTKTPEGDWSITVFLPPGRVVYGFSVDGILWLDPGDEGRVANGWGSEYSVRYVRDATNRR